MDCLKQLYTAIWLHTALQPSATKWHEGIIIMEETWESRFIKEAKSQGHSDDFIKECITYAQALRAKNMPVIFNSVHFANLVGIHNDQIYAILRYKEGNYSQYKIRKKSGGEREICSPSHVLKHIQRWIYVNILLRDIDVSEQAYGFIPKTENDLRNIYANASKHTDKNIIVTLDLKSFFDHIYEKRVCVYFMSKGYVEEVAKLLTSLCCFHYRCPQGAPTSPMLSNLIFRPVDDIISEYCHGNNLTYTRYADDITISADIMNPQEVIAEIKKILKEHGYKINQKKIHVRKKGMRQTVTGLTVSDGVHVPKSYRKEIWRELHFCKKFGVIPHVEHLNNLKGTNRKYYKSWLLGRIQYVRHINKDVGDKMLSEFNEVKWSL